MIPARKFRVTRGYPRDRHGPGYAAIHGAQKLIVRLGVASGFAFPIDVHMLRGHRSIANTAIYAAVADKRIRSIWK